MAGEIYLSGLTGQFDSAGFVQRMMQLKSLPLQKINQEIAISQAKASSLANLSSAIEDFYSFLESTTISDLFSNKSAISSDPDIATASATKDAPDISFNITVNSLSQREIRVTDQGFSALTGTFSSSGSFTIKFNKSATSFEEFTISYNAGETLEDLVNRINSSQAFVKASVYFDGSSYKLMLSETNVEDSNVETDINTNTHAIEIVGSLPTELGTNLNTLQEAKNASITIGNGSPITNPSNTFENIINGVTITVKQTGTASITIEEDNSTIEQFLNDFAEKYNAVIETINSLTNLQEGIFVGDYTINSIENGMSNLLDPLIQKGIIDYDSTTGKISINTESLDKLLSEDKEGAQTILENIRSSFKDYLEAQKDGISDYKQLFDDRIVSLEERASQLAERLAIEEQRLKYEYARIEAFIAEMNDIRQRLEQFTLSLSQMTGGNKK